MPAVGLTILALVATPSAPPAEKIGLSGPRFARGDELVYRGDVVETSDRIDTRFVKKYRLDVRVFVLESSADGCDCAVMTVLTPKPDGAVTSAVVAVSGANQSGDAVPSLRLELVRVDSRGQVKLLLPEAKLPLTFDSKTATTDPPVLPTDAPMAVELGIFLPLPLTAAHIGDTWDVVEANRPPVVWAAAKQTVVWNGRRVAEVTGLQQTDGYEMTKKVRYGWQRMEVACVSPTDGVVSTVSRTVVRREGNERIGSVTTTLELQPTTRQVGVKYRDTRAEVEAAWAFGVELEQLRANRAKADVLDAHRREVARFTELRPTGTGFRPAVEAVLRRYEANAAPPVAIRAAPSTVNDPPTVGRPAPDFACADVDKLSNRMRLSAVRGKPAVVVFFKSDSETSEETLTVCEALFRKYGEKVAVIPLSLGESLLTASKQRSALKYNVPVFDGAEVREKYAVRSYPQFFVVDGEGTLRWAFDAGIGPEVGSLVKKELEKVLK